MPATLDRLEQHFQLTISADKMTAELRLLEPLPQGMLNSALCRAILQTRGVRLSGADLHALEAAIARLSQSGSTGTLLQVRGTPRKDGQPGKIQLSEAIEAIRQRRHDAQTADRVDHYSQSNVICAKPGMIIGQVIPPTPGTDGSDVTGHVLRAVDGHPAPLRTDGTVLIDGKGQIIAQATGVLSIEHDLVRVLPVLLIPGSIDFSVGNVDVQCDVEIQGGIRDRFSVKTTGSLKVHKLIEAASIQVGGSFTAVAGMAAKARGSLAVAGNMHTAYLDNVTGEIQGDLETLRELLNCQLRVRGSLKMPNGSITGGIIHAGRGGIVAEFGSAGGVRTTLVLGELPEFQAAMLELQQRITTESKAHAAALAELATLHQNKAGKSPAEKERLTELMCEASMQDKKVNTLKQQLEALKAKHQSMRCLELTVNTVIHPGAVLVVDGMAYRFDKQVRGPVWIGRDANGEMIGRALSGGAPWPLSSVTSRSLQAA